MKESAAKKYVTTATRRSQRKIPSRITHPHAAPRIHPWFVFRVLCAPGISAVRFCSEVMKVKETGWG